MANLKRLKRLTHELAEEIEFEEDGPVFRLLKLLLDNITTYTIIIDRKHRIRFLNKAFIKYFEENNIEYNYESEWYKSVWHIEECPYTAGKEALEKREVITNQVKSPNTGKLFEVRLIFHFAPQASKSAYFTPSLRNIPNNMEEPLYVTLSLVE